MGRAILYALVAVLLLHPPAAASERTVILQPDGAEGADAWIANSTPYRAAGAEDSLLVGFMNGADPGPIEEIPIQISGGQNEWRSLLRFTLPEFPEDATILAADLSLYARNVWIGADPYASPVRIGARPAGADWIEGTEVRYSGVNWFYRFLPYAWSQPGGDFGPAEAEATVDGSTGWITWSIPGMVAGWIAEPDSNRGLFLARGTGTGAVVSFASGDHGEESIRPKLTIVYESAEGDTLPAVAEGAAEIHPRRVSPGAAAELTIHADLRFGGPGTDTGVDRLLAILPEGYGSPAVTDATWNGSPAGWTDGSDADTLRLVLDAPLEEDGRLEVRFAATAPLAEDPAGTRIPVLTDDSRTGAPPEELPDGDGDGTPGNGDDCVVRVAPGEPVRLRLEPENPEVSADSALLFTALAEDSAGVLFPVDPEWRVEGGVGSIDEAGLFDAGAAGDGSVIAEAGAAAGTTSVTVLPGMAAALRVAPADTTIALSGAVRYRAFARDGDGNEWETGAKWSVTPSGLGSVNLSGRFLPAAAGTGSVIGLASGFRDTASVTVAPSLPASIEIEPAEVEGTADTLILFHARVFDSGGTEIDTMPAWRVAGGVGTIDESGLFDGTTPGGGWVVASVGPAADSVPVTIVPGRLDSLAVLPADTVLTAGAPCLFTARGWDEDRNPFDPGAAWSEPTGRGSVDGAGLFTPRLAGDALLIASAGGLADTGRAAILPGPPASLEVFPASALLHTEQTLLFTAVVRDAEGNEIPDPGDPVWSGGERIGALDPATGLLEPERPGVDTVRASLGELEGASGAIEVVAGPTRFVLLTPSSASLLTGEEISFTAKTFDGEGNETEDPVAWTVLGGIGAVDGGGLFRAETPGEGAVAAAAGFAADTAAVSVHDDLGLVLEAVVEDRERVTRGEEDLPVALAVENRTGYVLAGLEGSLLFSAGGGDGGEDYAVTSLPFEGTLENGASDTLRFLVDVAADALTGTAVTVDGEVRAEPAGGGDEVAAPRAEIPGEWVVTGPPELVDLAGTLRPDRAVPGNEAAFSVAFRNEGETSLHLRQGTRLTFSGEGGTYEAPLASDLFLDGGGGSGLAFFDRTAIPAGFDPGEYALSLAPDGTDGNGAPFEKAVGAPSNPLLLLPPYVEATAPPVAGTVIRPGTAGVPLLRINLVNLYIEEKTFLSLRVADAGGEAGEAAERDLLWDRIVLRRDDDRDGAVDPGEEILAEGILFGGSLLLEGPGAAIPAGDTLALLVTGDLALLQAKDGGELDLTVETEEDILFAEEAAAAGLFPLGSPGSHFVDGCVAAQLDPRGGFPPGLPAGARDSLLLSIRIPSNGHAADELRSITVRNLGDAEAGTDLAGLRAWRDGGDGLFGGDDEDLGALVWTGDAWSRSGLARPVPPGGFRLFVSGNAAENPGDGRTVRLAVPVDGLVFASGNDGPVDADAVSPDLRVLGGAERVVLTDPVRPADGTILPGAKNREVLSFRLSNVYDDTVRLEGLVVANRSAGADPDGAAERVLLYGPSGAGKDPGPALDPLASASFAGGAASLSGFSAAVSPGEEPVFRIAVDAGLRSAADGDTIRLAIESTEAFLFRESRALSGGFPLLSAGPVVDGMAAAQIDVIPVEGGAVAPSETGRTVFSFVVPADGGRPDTLEGVRIAPEGTADDEDLSRVVLFAGGGTVPVGELVWNGSVWSREGIGHPVGAAGETLRVEADVSPDAREGRTILLAVPENGLTVRSGNDGPVDTHVLSPSLFYISTSPVFAEFRFSQERATAGQTLDLWLAVRNVSAADPRTFLGVEPFDVAPLGPEAILLGGPEPAAAESLPAGEEVLFRWTIRAETPGTAWFRGEALAGEAGGDTVQTLPTISPALEVDRPPAGVGVAATAALAGAVSRGETGAPLFLIALSHGDEAGSGAAPVRIDTVRVVLRGGNGAPLDPAAVLAALNAERSGRPVGRTEAAAFPSGVAAVALDEPVLLEPGEDATLALSADIRGDPQAGSFTVLLGEDGIAARDGNTNDPVPVSGVFPFSAGPAEVVIPPDSLVVEVAEGPPARVNRGAGGTRILRAVVESRGTTGVTADVILSAIRIGLPEGGFPYESIRITGPGITHFEGSGWTVENGDALFPLDPELTVPPNNPMEIVIAGDVDPLAPLGPFRLGLAESTFVDPEPAGEGGAVAVVLALPGPVESEVSVRVDSIAAAAEDRPDSSVARPGDGEREVLRVLFLHEGDSTRAAVRLEGVRVRLEDGAGDSTAIAPLVERLRVLEGEEALATEAPVDEEAASLPLLFGAPLLLQPGDSARVRIEADLKADAPPGDYRFVLPAAAVAATDGNESTPVTVFFRGGDPSAARSPLLPVRKTSDRISVRIDLDPPVLAAPGARIGGAGVLRLLPSGGEEEAPVHLTEIALRVDGPETEGIDPAGALRTASATAEEGTGPVEAILDADRLRFCFEPALVLAPAETVAIAFDLEVAEDPSVSSFRLHLPPEEIGLEEDGPLVVRAEGDEGRNPSGWIRLVAGGFGETLRNYPNPFSAGGEGTVFAFRAAGPGRAEIRIYTGLGEAVRTLRKAINGEGLVEIGWDGKNGEGDRVLSGGYLASVEVVYDGGGREHAIHKIAVLN